MDTTAPAPVPATFQAHPQPASTPPTPDATTPLLAEATADAVEMVTVSWKGTVFAVPASSEDWDGEVFEALDDQKLTYVVRHLLGEAQYARFKKLGVKGRDYKGFFDAVALAVGFADAGE